MTDFGFDSNTRPDVFAEIDPERPAPNWTVWHASADAAPRSLALALWHEPEMRGLAWIVFLGCPVGRTGLPAMDSSISEAVGIRDRGCRRGAVSSSCPDSIRSRSVPAFPALSFRFWSGDPGSPGRPRPAR